MSIVEQLISDLKRRKFGHQWELLDEREQQNIRDTWEDIVNQAPCNSLRAWFEENLGADCMAPITGTDGKALRAAAHILELYAYTRNDTLITSAFKTIVSHIQERLRYFAYHLIAKELDWQDRERIWVKAGLVSFRGWPGCKHGPEKGGRIR